MLSCKVKFTPGLKKSLFDKFKRYKTATLSVKNDCLNVKMNEEELCFDLRYVCVKQADKVKGHIVTLVTSTLPETENVVKVEKENLGSFRRASLATIESLKSLASYFGQFRKSKYKQAQAYTLDIKLKDAIHGMALRTHLQEAVTASIYKEKYIPIYFP